MDRAKKQTGFLFRSLHSIHSFILFSDCLPNSKEHRDWVVDTLCELGAPFDMAQGRED